ncbi:hypothetical protein VNI00_006626 [Paramarasmius palmivorus]|uniref:Methyltransferase domain-containing protein n=1 Tax=Paramarasmius palmivorus TaxID=297713 RepID=A0AAW0D732_9AGAR
MTCSSLRETISLLLNIHPNQATDTHLTHLSELLSESTQTQLVAHISRHSVDRTPIPIALPQTRTLHGIPSKKLHEITRLEAYLLSLHSQGIDTPYIVDIGAGQGFLTRVLPAKKVLALDSDGFLTDAAIAGKGKEGKEGKGAGRGGDTGRNVYNASVTHKTIHITPETLVRAVDEWVASFAPDDDDVPVTLVALHACGSLSVDTFRAFFTSNSNQSTGSYRRRWYINAVLTIPCCYNLLRPGDFPLSSSTFSSNEALLPNPLPPSAYHLAAQVPENQTPNDLSVRKVVYRALLTSLLPPTSLPSPSSSRAHVFVPPSESRSAPPARQNLISNTIASPAFSWGAQTHPDELGNSPLHYRLGKLPRSAYESWEAFLEGASMKLGLGVSLKGEWDEEKARKVEELHMWRCRLGPVVESAVLGDRVRWVEDALRGEGGGEWKVELVPVFDQAKGSARNMAVVLLPLPG